MRVGVLTGGGDAPGLNPAIKGLVYRGSELGLEVIGLFDGWRSLMNPAPDVLPLIVRRCVVGTATAARISARRAPILSGR